MGLMEGATWKAWYEIHPSDREKSLTPSMYVWAYGCHFWDSYIASSNSSPNGGFNLPPAFHPPPPPIPPPIICRK